MGDEARVDFFEVLGRVRELFYFSRRKRFFDSLQRQASAGKEFVVAWPDVLLFVEPAMVERAYDEARDGTS